MVPVQRAEHSTDQSGFEIRRHSTAMYRCNDANADVAITTIAAGRI